MYWSRDGLQYEIGVSRKSRNVSWSFGIVVWGDVVSSYGDSSTIRLV